MIPRHIHIYIYKWVVHIHLDTISTYTFTVILDINVVYDNSCMCDTCFSYAYNSDVINKKAYIHWIYGRAFLDVYFVQGSIILPLLSKWWWRYTEREVSMSFLSKYHSLGLFKKHMFPQGRQWSCFWAVIFHQWNGGIERKCRSGMRKYFTII